MLLLPFDIFPVNLDDQIYDRKNHTSNLEASSSMGNLFSIAETSVTYKEDMTAVQMHHQAGDGLRLRKAKDTRRKSSSKYRNNVGSDSDSTVQTDFSFSTKSEKSKKSVPAETEHENYSSQIDEEDNDTINPDRVSFNTTYVFLRDFFFFHGFMC
jgi:hypothetical protein